MRHSESLWKLLLCTVASAVLLPTTGSAQFRPKDTEWPSYAADLAGSRYRSLDQINASNFNDLEIAKAQLELDTDQLSEAREDLARAANDDRTRIQRELTARETATAKFDAKAAAPLATAS